MSKTARAKSPGRLIDFRIYVHFALGPLRMNPKELVSTRRRDGEGRNRAVVRGPRPVRGRRVLESA
jgi:hypothetical protein